jgi:hypothetical protein
VRRVERSHPGGRELLVAARLGRRHRMNGGRNHRQVFALCHGRILPSRGSGKCNPIKTVANLVRRPRINCGGSPLYTQTGPILFTKPVLNWGRQSTPRMRMAPPYFLLRVSWPPGFAPP